MARKQYRAAGGVVFQQGILPDLSPSTVYILLLDRPARNEVRLPKGHIDAGESESEAALRETVEEAGYADLEIVADLGEQVVEYDYKNDHYVREERYFLMQLQSGQQQPRPPQDAKQFQPIWVSAQEARSRLTFAAEQEWLDRALRQLESLL